MSDDIVKELNNEIHKLEEKLNTIIKYLLLYKAEGLFSQHVMACDILNKIGEE